MNIIEKLKYLKETHDILGLKAEFEAEGATFSEISKLNELISEQNLNLTIKIGGCEAINDIYFAKTLGAKAIVAPMIESVYAMQKFVRAINALFLPSEKNKTKFLINIESITGFNNLDEIISSPYFKDIDGITLGRSDMAYSMGLTKKDVNCCDILNMALVLSKKMQEMKKDFIIGGNVSFGSISFLKKIPYLTNFETRKVVFKTNALNNQRIDDAIKSAIEFEILWLKHKKTFSNNNLKIDNERLLALEENYKNNY